MVYNIILIHLLIIILNRLNNIMNKNISHFGDIIAISFFLLIIYYYNIKKKNYYNIYYCYLLYMVFI